MAKMKREPLKDGITRVTYPTGKVVYVARWSWTNAAGERDQAVETHDTLKAARTARAKALAAIAESRYESPSKLTVDEYAQQWLTRRERDWSTSTAYIRRRQYENHVKPRLGGHRIAKVTRAQCQALTDDLSEEYAPANVRTIMALVSGLFSGAEKEGIVPRNPAEKLDLPAVRNEPKVVWTADQVRAFLNATREHRDHALYVLLLRTGLRIGEALALRWAQVDLDRATVIVTDTMRRNEHGAYGPQPGTKTTKNRLVPLSGECLDVLRRHQAKQAEQRRSAPVWNIGNYVFTSTSRVDGRPLDYADFCRRLRENLDTLPQLPRLTAHGFRHTVSALLRQGGIDPTTRAAMLGHSPQVNMDSYTSISAEDLRKAAAALGDTLDDAEDGETTTTSSQEETGG